MTHDAPHPTAPHLTASDIESLLGSGGARAGRALAADDRDALLAHLADCRDCRQALGAVWAWQREGAAVLAGTAPMGPPAGRVISLRGALRIAAIAACLLIVFGLALILDNVDNSGDTTNAADTDTDTADNDGEPSNNTENRNGGDGADPVVIGPEKALFGDMAGHQWTGRITVVEATDNVRFVDDPSGQDAVEGTGGADEVVGDLVSVGQRLTTNRQLLLGSTGRVIVRLDCSAGGTLLLTQEHGRLTRVAAGLIVSSGLCALVSEVEPDKSDTATVGSHGDRALPAGSRPLLAVAGQRQALVVDCSTAPAVWLVAQASFAMAPTVEVLEGRAEVTRTTRTDEGAGGRSSEATTVRAGQRFSDYGAESLIENPVSRLPVWAVPPWADDDDEVLPRSVRVSWRLPLDDPEAVLYAGIGGEVAPCMNPPGGRPTSVWQVPHCQCTETMRHVHGELRTASAASRGISLSSRHSVILRCRVSEPVTTLAIWLYHDAGIDDPNSQEPDEPVALFGYRRHLNMTASGWLSLEIPVSELQLYKSGSYEVAPDSLYPLTIHRLRITSGYSEDNPKLEVAMIAVLAPRG